MQNTQENIPLKDYTTLGIGGPAESFIEVKSEEELKSAVKSAIDSNTPHLIIAGGSNLLVHDAGIKGLVIKISYSGIEHKRQKVKVKPGTGLQELVDYCNENALSGMEKLAGIPGSVGGAVYGNAGAFGQTISDKLARVRAFNGDMEFNLSKNDCRFEYRDSGFKNHKDWVILEIEFEMNQGDSGELKKISTETIEKRKEKYHPGIKCPGSFFKNVFIVNLPKEIQGEMPQDYYGKVPAWYFLERVGAKGAKKGDIEIADFHANLFMNRGNGQAQDFFDLAKEYKDKVYEKFGIELEPEVQLIGFDKEL